MKKVLVCLAYVTLILSMSFVSLGAEVINSISNEGGPGVSTPSLTEPAHLTLENNRLWLSAKEQAEDILNWSTGDKYKDMELTLAGLSLLMKNTHIDLSWLKSTLYQLYDKVADQELEISKLKDELNELKNSEQKENK